ncbi:hypothetical protein DDB_G0267298 [Dictyostelium discoideum AX4]|uniref:Uncharacterized protein n=1 Tax=Dictyostelium discoideum TaxID=44689 RepID=Q55H08_DICDI|nr:hypothetical protein DDB_G0267298 [Dictyostelium discoideum AX4]EAL73786.1 hypothetical protein DDB_G0267298 [Dictyostelium discoideum AX4]|eukprot:XP_647710.1 hypothetical protein DDB_G0267298 [Dictyostelium discoideum AX4]
MEQLVTICFKLYSDSFDENDLISLQVLIESFNAKVNLITETEITNFHLDEQYERVTKLNMVKFFKLKSIEPENNLDNIKIKLDSLFQNYKNLTFHSSIKNNKEIYNVGDAVEVASYNELSGRWSGIINSISMIEMDDN